MEHIYAELGSHLFRNSLTQESKWGLLLWLLYQLSYQGSPSSIQPVSKQWVPTMCQALQNAEDTKLKDWVLPSRRSQFIGGRRMCKDLLLRVRAAAEVSTIYYEYWQGFWNQVNKKISKLQQNGEEQQKRLFLNPEYRPSQGQKTPV